MSNCYQAAGLLVERIRTAIPSLKACGTFVDLDDGQAQQPAPACYVGLLRERLASEVGQGQGQEVAQTWGVLVVVRNVKGVGGAEAFAAGGEIVGTLIEQLSGWEPAIELDRLRRVNAPAPAYANGFAYLYVAFETTLFTQGA